MRRLSKLFLAVLFLTVASVSWAACPEGTKNNYKGECVPTVKSARLPSYVEIEIPTYVDKAKASPWNFFDDFESSQLTGYGLTTHTMKSHPESVLENIFEFKKKKTGTLIWLSLRGTE